jgi:hypothetical protein
VLTAPQTSCVLHRSCGHQARCREIAARREMGHQIRADRVTPSAGAATIAAVARLATLSDATHDVVG